MVRVPVYAAFGVVVFFVAVALTFPDEQIKDIVTVEVEKQLGGKYSVQVGELDVWWFTGASLENVTIEERVDPSEVQQSPEEEEAGVPADKPMKVTIPRMSGRLAILRSLFNAAPAIDFEVDVGGGIIDGSFVNGSEARELYVEIDEIDLRKTLALTAFLGLPFFGELDGTIDLQMHPKRPMVTGGSIALKGKKLTVGPATIKTDKFPPITYLEIPQTNFGTLDIQLQVTEEKKRKKMAVDKFKWEGRDIRGDLWGAFDMASRVEQTRADVEMRMQLDENFVKKNNLGPLLNVAEVRRGKNKDWFGFRLYGRLKNIRFKGSPKSASGPEAAKGDDSKPTEGDDE
jgi:type II secretion system protein N